MVQIEVSSTANISLQVGDTAWYVPTTSVGNQSYGSDPVEIGIITGITDGYIIISDELSTPDAGDFIMFSKDKTANNTSLLGYYAEVELKNNSLNHAELFALSSEVAPSSK